MPKSVMFKTMGYSAGFFLKIVEFVNLTNAPGFDLNTRATG